MKTIEMAPENVKAVETPDAEKITAPAAENAPDDTSAANAPDDNGAENFTYTLERGENAPDAENFNLAVAGGDTVETAATYETAVEKLVEFNVTGAVYVGNNATALERCIAIFNQGDNIMKKGMALKIIAVGLIERGELYKERGYKTITDFAEKELRLAKQTTRRYLQVAENFFNLDAFAPDATIPELIDENGNFKKNRQFKAQSIFADSEGNDFTPTTLQAIAAIPAKVIQQLLDSGEISYDMTLKKINAAVAPYRKSAQNSPDDTSENETPDASEIDGAPAPDETPDAAPAKTESKTSKMAIETIERYKAMVDKLNAKIDALTIERAQLQAENDELRKIVDSYEKRIDELENENSELAAQLENKTPDAEIFDNVEVGNINPKMQEFYEKIIAAKKSAPDKNPDAFNPDDYPAEFAMETFDMEGNFASACYGGVDNIDCYIASVKVRIDEIKAGNMNVPYATAGVEKWEKVLAALEKRKSELTPDDTPDDNTPDAAPENPAPENPAPAPAPVDIIPTPAPANTENQLAAPDAPTLDNPDAAPVMLAPFTVTLVKGVKKQGIITSYREKSRKFKAISDAVTAVCETIFKTCETFFKLKKHFDLGDSIQIVDAAGKTLLTFKHNGAHCTYDTFTAPDVDAEIKNAAAQWLDTNGTAVENFVEHEKFCAEIDREINGVIFKTACNMFIDMLFNPNSGVNPSDILDMAC